MSLLHQPRKPSSTWVPENQRTPGWAIFNFKFLASVPYIHSLSSDYIKHFGTPASGDKANDRAMLNERIDTMLTINDMVEYYRKGVIIGIKVRADVIKVYELITDYLVYWDRIIRTNINIMDAPFDDLELMNKFADAVYDHAKWDLPKVDHEHYAFMAQIPISHAAILEGTRGAIDNTNPDWTPPERDSFEESFAKIQESMNYSYFVNKRGK